MKKAAVGLKLTYSSLVPVTCLAHGLSLVAEKVRACFPKVDSLISNVKKIFLKAPNRVSKYKEMYADLPLPPKPVLTRWGTWLDAATFYAEHFEAVKDIISTFDPEDAASIQISNTLLNDAEIQGQLACISSNYANLARSIKKLESNKLCLSDAIEIFETCERQVKSTKSAAGMKISQKMEDTVSKNSGFKTLKQINLLLQGENGVLPNDLQLAPRQLASFKYAPVTTCDVERSFSAYKRTLSDRRHNLTTENLGFMLVVQAFYNFVDDDVSLE